jgi:hypothetical protein
MRKLLHLIIFVFYMPAHAVDIYDGNKLFIPFVFVGPTLYSDVQVTVGKIISVANGKANPIYDRYNPANNLLSIPAVKVGVTTYTNVTIEIGSVLAVGGSSQAFETEAYLSPAPDYSGLQVSNSDLANIWDVNQSSTVNIKGMDGVNRIFLFPSYARNSAFTEPCRSSICPLLSAVELSEYEPNKLRMTRLIDEVKIGLGRAWTFINQHIEGSKSFVIVDSGLEPAGLPHAQWPHGYVWQGIDDGRGFTFKRISNTPSFNHSIASGDLNGDGRDDLVVTTMGSKRPCYGLWNSSLEFFLSTNLDNFTVDAACVKDDSVMNGSGGVTIADVLGNGRNQIINANYMTTTFTKDWGAIRIYSGQSSSSIIPEVTVPREGLFLDMGATKVIAFDYDQDGKQDLLVSLESFDGRNGIEIYRNLGAGKFSRVTNQLLRTNIWNFAELQYRELVVADVNFDGFPDIVLNGWNGARFKLEDSLSLDVGALIFLNRSGLGFENPTRTKDSQVRFESPSQKPMYLRFMDVDASTNSLRFLGVSAVGAPIVIRTKLRGS